MNKPLISVVVPVYNVEEFLDDCVQSIVNQTYKNLEIILVDDGSSDHCPEICDKWLKTDSRIQVIRKNNGGLSSARNVGVERATGEYIGFIDSDDYIHPQMYECLLSALRKSSLKIASCTFKRVLNSDETEILSGICKAEELNLKESLDSVFYGDMSVSVCCKLFAKEVFTSVRFPVGETNEDACVTIPTLALSEGTVYIREKMYCYRDRATSITHSYWKTDADIVYLHLQQMQKQLDSIGYGNLPSFKVYLVDSVYSVALCLDKNYSRITETAKENQLKYLAIMRRYWLRTIFSRHVVVKDKLLYSLIVTRTLRPVYTVLGKELN